MTDDLLVSDIRAALSRPRSPVTAAEVIAAHHSSPANSWFRRPRRMRSYAIGAMAMATAICVLVVVMLVGVSSSNPTGRPAGVPASWQKVTFGGLTMYAPGNWPVGSEHSWGDCGPSMQPFFKVNAVELDTGADPVLYHCRSNHPNGVSGNGLLVDPGPFGPLPDVGLPDAPGIGGKPLHVNGLTIEVAGGPIVVVAVHIPGVARAVAVEIGGGSWKTILYSIRASGSNPTVPPTTPTTPQSNTGQWPSRTVTASRGGLGTGLSDIVPTENAVYWLSRGSKTVTPVRYDLTTGEVKNGPGISSDYGESDLAVAGGLVWVAVASGPDVLVERLDPTTLAIQDRISLPVKNNLITGQQGIFPVTTTTTKGPVWVAGGEDVWALNPATGAIETEFDAGDEIWSLSTDPAGTLVYTGGQTNAARGDWSVKEYDAQTGKDLVNTQGQVVAGIPTVAATTGGVWVSQVSGNEVGVAEWSGGVGADVELSAKSLQLVAPPASELQRFGPFLTVDYGEVTSVSEGTLWLTGLGSGDNPTLTCANPTTGAVEATASTSLAPFVLIASGHSLYAITSPTWAHGGGDSVVVITPPAACFG